jgi:integrase
MSWQDVPAFMGQLRQAEGMGARALELAVLCASRSGEVRGATWAEVDLEAAVWTIPAARMKTGKPHVVPLSKPALAMLKKLPKGDPEALLFPGAKKGKELSDMSLLAVLKRMEVDVTVHGFRASFKSWAGDNSKDREVVELSLAHALGNAVEQAYSRTSLLDRRRKLMAEWAAFTA